MDNQVCSSNTITFFRYPKRYKPLKIKIVAELDVKVNFMLKNLYLSLVLE